jgi:hypothetical protein
MLQELPTRSDQFIHGFFCPDSDTLTEGKGNSPGNSAECSASCRSENPAAERCVLDKMVTVLGACRTNLVALFASMYWHGTELIAIT